MAQGDALRPEDELITEYGFSRPALREALRILEAEGLIAIARGHHTGARVQGPDIRVVSNYAGLLLQTSQTTLADVLTTTAQLQIGAIGLLCELPVRLRTRPFRSLLAAEDEALGDVTAFSAAEHTFQVGLIKATDDKTLILLSAVLEQIVERHLLAVTALPERHPIKRPSLQSTYRSHTELVAHIQAGERGAAENLWIRHSREWNRWLVQSARQQTVLDLFE